MDRKVADISHLSRAFSVALNARAPIFSQIEATATDCMRLFRGNEDGLPGFIVDRFGKIAWAQFREGEAAFDWDTAKNFIASCHDTLHVHGIQATYLKRYVPDRSILPNLSKDGVDFEFVVGEPAKDWLAHESGLKFRILPSENFSPGIFLDQRDNRSWVRSISERRRVLNLFAYTGAFSVFAAKGGASEVTTVDVSKKWLEVAKDNFVLNDIAPERHRFFATGAVGFLETAAKRAEKYDLIIADPPIFSRSERDGVFSLGDRREELWQACARCLNPGGLFFFSCNWQQTDSVAVRLEMDSLFGKDFSRVDLPAVPADFAGADNPISVAAYSRGPGRPRA